MIDPTKLPNALYALQAVLVRARAMANEPNKREELVDLLDYAEYLPCLIAKQTDETDRFRANLEEISNRHQCAFVLQRFDEPVPPTW